MVEQSMPQKNPLAPLAIVTISLLLAFIRIDYCVDDGFIFARIATNLVEGNGWSFNPGNPANAITSPLWLALLAIVALVTTLDLGSFAGL
jgi:hypothetical protein